MEAAGRETVSGDDEPFRQTSRFPALRCKRELNPEDAIVPSATGEEIMSNGTMATRWVVTSGTTNVVSNIILRPSKAFSFNLFVNIIFELGTNNGDM